RPRCARTRTSSASVARGTRTGSEEERDGGVEAGREALERPAAERVVDPQDQARHRPPEETEDSADLRAPRAGLEVLEARDPVQVVRVGDQRLEPDDVLDVESMDSVLSGARKAPAQLAGKLVPAEVELGIEPERRPPRRLAAPAEAGGIQAERPEGRSEDPSDGDARPGEPAALVVLTRVPPARRVLCGAVRGGVEAPSLPCRLIEQAQASRVRWEHIVGDGRLLDRPVER